MKISIRNHVILLILLTAAAVLFVGLDEQVNVDNPSFQSMFFIIATFIVIMTIYIILRMIIYKYPDFLQKGIWENPIHTLFIGTFALVVVLIAFMLIANNLEWNPMVNKAMTFLMAYPVAFILIVMVDAFLSRIYQADRDKRLFISSMSIVLGLAVMIIFSLLQTL